MGVIREVVDPAEAANIYASNCLIVLEERFYGGLQKVQFRSRLTVDQRSLNKSLACSSWPLPNLDEFRRKLSGYNVYSNQDFKEHFHQICVDEHTQRLFGIHALGRIYASNRLLMGCVQSANLAHFVSDRCYSTCARSVPFLDDVTTCSYTKLQQIVQMVFNFFVEGFEQK